MFLQSLQHNTESHTLGAGKHGSRKAIMMLGVLIVAVLLLIMDLNRPQRGMVSVSVGVGILERVQDSIADLQTTYVD